MKAITQEIIDVILPLIFICWVMRLLWEYYHL